MKETEKYEKYDLNWANNPKHKDTFPFPISTIYDGKWWVATVNEDTEKLIGDEIGACALGETEEDAIRKMFMLIRYQFEHHKEEALRYERWVPIIVGSWGRIGGTWISIFGIKFYFRYGSGMRGGVYVPLTKLNISTQSAWKAYKNWKLNKKNEDCN